MTRAAARYLDVDRERGQVVAPPAGDFYVALRRKAQRPQAPPILRLVQPEPPAGRAAAVRARFRDLSARWKSETRFESSSTRLVLHPAYQQIIGLGPDALPLIFEALEREPDHWSWALKAITGADPVPPDARGNVRRTAEAWLAWARRQGLR